MERGESAQGGDESVAAISVGLAGKRSQRLDDLDKTRYRSKLYTVFSTGNRRTLYSSNCGMNHSQEEVWSLDFQAGRDDPPPGPLGTLARSPRHSSISTNQGLELFAWPRNVLVSFVLVSESLSREYSLCILYSDLSTTIMSQLDIPPLLRPEQRSKTRRRRYVLSPSDRPRVHSGHCNLIHEAINGNYELNVKFNFLPGRNLGIQIVRVANIGLH